MSLAEVVPILKMLPREERKQLAELLNRDLANEELAEELSFLSKSPQEVWSPFDAYEAAETLLEVLRADGAKK